MRWETCIDEHIARHDNPSDAKINRLREQSQDTRQTIHELPDEPASARSKALLAYDAVRELLEAVAYKEGFDIHNHECYRAFLQEVMGASDLAKTFDDLRKQRNRLEYDGKTISSEKSDAYVETAEDLYDDLTTFF